MTDTWTPAFQATMTSIFAAAESDLRALGFGGIERTDTGLSLGDGRETPSITLATKAVLADGAIVVMLHVQITAPAVCETSNAKMTDMRDAHTLARRNLAVVELADRWVQRWGHLRWTVDEAMGSAQ